MREISVPDIHLALETPPQLVLKRSGLSRVIYDIDLGETIVGQNLECGVMLIDPEVRHEHFRIRRGETYCAVEPLSATAVTWINGVRLTQRAMLKDQDKIKAGASVLTFHANTPSPQVPRAQPEQELIAEVSGAADAPTGGGRENAISPTSFMMFWTLVAPLILAAFASLVAVEGRLLLFTAYTVTLWFGLMNGGLVLNGRSFRQNPRVACSHDVWIVFLFALAITLVQSVLLFLALMLWNMGLPGSLFLQAVCLLLSAAAASAVGLVFSCATSSRLVVACLVPLVLAAWMLLSGYPVPTRDMHTLSSTLASVTPGHAAQSIMDASILWDQRASAAMRTRYPEAIRSVGGGTADTAAFRPWRAVWIGILVLAIWCIAGAAASFVLRTRKAKY